ncbi:alpha beta-hydrolase [Trichoderma arundinaceum]|uniref:Alpha beta-hydrolase n=1 Tax=Trichoderma arundinaceum TaxID=490622 RepID=A0A395NY59_TRIAR|nr:alpha beta-hydrolase [Trichoderma arundinaceum]
MSTYATAEDKFVDVDGIKFAYRRLGLATGVPLLLIMHFRGTMDHWDPALINPLAAKRPVILIAHPGSGRSQGHFPSTMAQNGQYFINFITKLGLTQMDVMGFSGGGCTAQMVALNASKLVRHLILSATTPSIGEGIQIGPVDALQKLRTAITEEEHKDAFVSTFFTPNTRGQAAGREAWERITTGRQNRCDYASVESAGEQGLAYFNFINPDNADDGSYNRFHEFQMPVLIATGSADGILPTENSIAMWKKISHSNAELHIFPDAGHGFLYQYADCYAALINDFLDR